MNKINPFIHVCGALTFIFFAVNIASHNVPGVLMMAAYGLGLYIGTFMQASYKP